MMFELPEPMTLEDLSEKVPCFLRELGLVGAQVDHRVCSVPDARTIRYYTTLGLLDRPSIQGRQAYYGKRHALQLLAIKGLQARSLPLAEIQQRLYGCSNTELESIIAALASPQELEAESIKLLQWREVTIEPGLKLFAEAGWSSVLSDEGLEKCVRAALAVLKKTPDKGERREIP